MTTLLAFLFALAVLIAVHEYGHYRVAVAMGVKVLRFSIGFGQPLLRWRLKRRPTEFVLAAFPLGGYVRMLDEREAPVPEHERHMAFNRQPLRARAAIVAAGPAANLLLAVVLLAAVAWMGVQAAAPVLSTPPEASLAERAGLAGGDRVTAVARDDEEAQSVRSFEELRWQLTQAALDRADLWLWLGEGDAAVGRRVLLPLSALDTTEVDAELFRRMGIVSPWAAPVMGEVLPDGAAAAAGLQAGDRVLAVDEATVGDAQALRALILGSVDEAGESRAQRWTVERAGQRLSLKVSPAPVLDKDGGWQGRVGAYIGGTPELVEISSSAPMALLEGLRRTWDMSWLTLKTLGQMVLGQASLKNLSGPLTIADFAGQTASLGLVPYLQFLAMISVSLGVLNLLPLPILDGGHLMYYLWEGVTGREVSEQWMERLQRGGVAILALLMSVALFNDVARLLG